MRLSSIVSIPTAGILLIYLTQLSYQLTRTEKQIILDEHNRQRAEIANGRVSNYPSASDMILLDWDEENVIRAKSLSDSCVFNHDSASDREYGRYKWVGQNLAWWTGNYYKNISGPVFAWYDEYRYYNYNTKGCQSGQQCGHFTQNVWKSSAFTGCGLTRCGGSRGNILACNYSPGGNFNGAKPYTEGTPCSQCPRGYNKCMGGLCATPSQCQRAGVQCQSSSSAFGSASSWLDSPRNDDGIIARVPGVQSQTAQPEKTEVPATEAPVITEAEPVTEAEQPETNSYYTTYYYSTTDNNNDNDYGEQPDCVDVGRNCRKSWRCNLPSRRGRNLYPLLCAKTCGTCHLQKQMSPRRLFNFS